MNQRNLTKYVVAFLIFFMATSCSKENSSNLPVTENFKALVMGGKDIDPNQTWSTASNIPVTISVDFLSGSKYTIYIYQSHPASDNNITYLGMTTIVSGESKTIYVAKPADVSQLFAACYDDQQHVICVPIVNGQAKFSGKISTSTTMPTITTGNNWSVPTQSMPDLSKYTTGTLTEASELSPDLADDAEARLKISDSYTGFIPFLGTHSNMSVYVTSTWTLTYDQRINAGNVIVVGNGGKIIVPKGFKLTTTPLGESTVMGRIYVMPGGEISGDGIVEFSCEASGCNYNEGHLTTGEVSIVSGTLYNTGIIGDNVTPTTKLVGSAVNESSAKFVNLASAYFSEVNASTLSILNGGVIRVSDNLTLGQNARMDDGSSLSCGSLTLQGNGSNVLYMGNAAELNCSGRISVSNFGVWGPSGDKYVANARLRVGGCTQISASSGNASDFLLDHIQLEVPIGASGLDMLSGWMNGSCGDIEGNRQTCFCQLEGTQSTPKNGCVYYAFEVADNYSIRDFDYNDVVLRVSMPFVNGDGTYTISVNVAAVGSSEEIQVLYNGEDFGKEVHEVLGVASNIIVNTSSKDRDFQVLGLITYSNSDVEVDKLPFSLRKKGRDGSSQTLRQSANKEEAPLYLVINADSFGKWQWPKENSNIGLAYKLFGTWANNAQTALDWYKGSNASSNRVVAW